MEGRLEIQAGGKWGSWVNKVGEESFTGEMSKLKAKKKKCPP